MQRRLFSRAPCIVGGGRRHLDVDEQLQQVPGRHDDGGVERDDVALVQTQVQVGRQPLNAQQRDVRLDQISRLLTITAHTHQA